MSYDGRTLVATAAAGALGMAAIVALNSAVKQRRVDRSKRTTDNRASVPGVVARWTKPVVIASPGLEDLAVALRKRLGCEEYSVDAGPTVSMERFKSGDPNMKFHWERVVGRRIIFLFDTVDQSRLFEQLSLLQALQGFAVPDADDKDQKWKTYVNRGGYSWGRASQITVVLPWYRPCQMERTSRWQLKDGKWINSDPNGQWLDVPTAQYLARLLATPGSVPPLPGPSDAMDGMPIHPLWRPPLELLFMELHEEGPVSHSVSDLGATIRMERFVPYFLERFKLGTSYPGAANMYVLFPDRGAYDRYHNSVIECMKLDFDHILYIKKTRVAESIEQVQKLFFENGTATPGQKSSFLPTDVVLIIDDFTNSGGTLFGAVNLVRTMAGEKAVDMSVNIFVSHLVAGYDPKVVEEIKVKLRSMGPSCKFFTTNSIPLTTAMLKGEPQAKVIDISGFVADMVQNNARKAGTRSLTIEDV